MVTIKFPPEWDTRGFIVLKDAARLTCLSDDRYVIGEKHLKALYEGGIPFKVVSPEPAQAVEALRVGYGDLGVSCHITNSAVEPGVQVNTNHGTVVITAPGDVKGV
jgi:hypothetical protein